MSLEEDLTKFEQQLQSFTIAGASGSFARGFIVSGGQVSSPGEGTGGSGPPPPATGACCFDDFTCGVLSEDDCATASGDYQGDNTECDACPGCPQFTVSIHYELEGSVVTADFTKVSDPTTADMGEAPSCSQFEAFTDVGICVATSDPVNFDQLTYSLLFSAGVWLLGVDFTSNDDSCTGDAITFQPSDILSADPTGTYPYTLSAAGLDFTITVDITPYP